MKHVRVKADAIEDLKKKQLEKLRDALCSTVLYGASPIMNIILGKFTHSDIGAKFWVEFDLGGVRYSLGISNDIDVYAAFKYAEHCAMARNDVVLGLLEIVREILSE